jgi:hypothetical protein
MPNILRSRRFQLLIGAVVVLSASFYAALWAIDRYFPGAPPPAVANLPPLPPLEPVTRSSYVIAPVAISIQAIQERVEQAAPRELFGKKDDPVSALLSAADIGINVKRSPLAIRGQPDDLAVGATIEGSLKVSGEIANLAGSLAGMIGSTFGNKEPNSSGSNDDSIGGIISGFLGDKKSSRTGGDSGASKTPGSTTTKAVDQTAELHGRVIMHSRPTLTENWRLEPNMSAQLDLSDSKLRLAGADLNVTQEAKPTIDSMVNDQVANLEKWLRDSPIIENVAREQWAKACRAIPLGGGNTGLPPLWLELRPLRAAAAQPRIDAQNVTLTVGVLAETRISSTESKPTCPFPAKLELVAPMDDGRLQVDMPIDVPFTELDKLLEAQLKGHTFPEDDNAPGSVEVRAVRIGASGDRLLISLDVRAREKKSWFGFGVSATVQIWGKPALDEQNQILRLTDLSVAVESAAAFGLLGPAARAAVPYLEKALADHAVIDLKPFVADALKKIGIALADFEKNSPDIRVSAGVTGIRLTDITFDSHTLRVIGAATGTARIAISRLPAM